MSENAKKKFTIFDILIGAAVLLVIAAIAYVLVVSPMTDNVAETKTLEFTVDVQSSNPDVVALLNEGDTVTISGKSEAKLSKVEYKDAEQIVIDQLKGEYTTVKFPEKYDITVTVTGNASETAQDISIGNMPIKVGMSVSIEGKGYSINGYVTDMNLIGENGEVIEND